MEKISHRDLVDSSYTWLVDEYSCEFALKEFYSSAINSEYPDVIGFKDGGVSVLIECKVSYLDFVSDQKKKFREDQNYGMGCRRFYCCPSELLNIEDIPLGWGLIYVNKELESKCVYDPYDENASYIPFNRNIEAEHGLMFTLLRRLSKEGKMKNGYIKGKTGSDRKASVTIQDETEIAILELNIFLIEKGKQKQSKENMINWSLQTLSEIVKHLDEESLENLVNPGLNKL